MQRILVTGSAGRLGQAAVQSLVAAGHFVRGFDRVATANASESIIGDIGDQNAILNAARDTKAIIHLAATPDEADFMTSLLPNNVAPVHHVLEAARIHGRQRVVLASSGQVNWHQHFNGPFPLRVEDPLTPRYWYAVTKIFGEFAGKVYAQEHGMDVVALRLGACPRDRASVEAIGKDETIRNVYLSPGDAGRFFASVIEATGGFGFQPVFVCGRFFNRAVMDLEPARRLFGYEPQDRWPEGLPPEIIGDQPIPGGVA